MAKIGYRFRETRLRKGLTLERVAADTNIGIKYLEGLEDDDHSFFPGEPYTVGFMRNYAEYLGMDGLAIVAEYRAPGSQGAPETAAPSREPPGPAEGAPDAGMAGGTGPAAGWTHGEAEDAPPAMPGSPAENPAKPARGSRRSEARNAGARNAGAKKPASPGEDELPGEAERPNPPAFPAAREPGGTVLPPAGAVPAGTEAINGTAREGAFISADNAALRPRRRRWVIAAAVVILLGVAIASLAYLRGRTRIDTQAKNGGTTERTDYRVEGSAFEKRLYPEDGLLVSVGSEVYKLRLSAITDAVNFETPFGPLRLGLGEEGSLDPDGDGRQDLSLIVGDFSRNNPALGALVRVEFQENSALPATEDAVVDVATEPARPAAPASAAPGVLFRSTRGAYPFVIIVTFRGPCMFRYEADRKEWIEKYYSKGESITINANNAVLLWASNAQAARVTVQASGGKTSDLELGGPGEIAVKRLSWSLAEGSWALIAADAD